MAATPSVILLIGLLFGLVPACSSGTVSTKVRVTVPDGFTVEEVVTGLHGPTQIDELPDGRLVVAQLNGKENGATGQIVVVKPSDAVGASAHEVWFSGLDKPTGVVVVGREVWVMERRRLSRGPVGGGELSVVFDDLPYNGRSQGTLSATSDGRVVYNTSGRKSGGDVVDGSGLVLVVDPDTLKVNVIASGLKHGYARTFGPDGRWWQTEMTDGTFDGQPAPDELMMAAVGDDFGWPRCVGDRRAVAEFGGSDEICSATARSHALFQPGATPTSVIVAPWDPDMLLVALWNEGRVVEVPVSTDGAPIEDANDFIVGIERPQHLLVVDKAVFVSDFADGRILRVAPA